jgi:hypothetical protein
MEVGALKVMVAGLLTWIHVNGELPSPPDQPEVAFVTAADLAKLVCHNKCDVKGFSPDDGSDIIYLDQSLDIEHDVCQRSILVHELVHFIQRRAKRFSDEPPAYRTHWREMEALQIQREYLDQFGRRLFIGPQYAAMGLGYPYC